MKEILKIVITGGPCAGKTSALRRIKERYSKLGFEVVHIPETATELISGGISPMSVGSSVVVRINLHHKAKNRYYSCR